MVILELKQKKWKLWLISLAHRGDRIQVDQHQIMEEIIQDLEDHIIEVQEDEDVDMLEAEDELKDIHLEEQVKEDLI